MTTLDKIEAEAEPTLAALREFRITDQASMDLAKKMRLEIVRQLDAIEAERTSITKPINESLRKINARYKDGAKFLDQYKALLDKEITAADRRTREAQDQALAQIQASGGQAVGEVLAVAHGHQLAQAAGDGLSTRVTWEAEIVDLAAFVAGVVALGQAATFLTPHLPALNAHVRKFGAGHGLPGVKATEKTVISQRRS